YTLTLRIRLRPPSATRFPYTTLFRSPEILRFCYRMPVAAVSNVDLDVGAVDGHVQVLLQSERRDIPETDAADLALIDRRARLYRAGDRLEIDPGVGAVRRNGARIDQDRRQRDQPIGKAA